MNRTAFIAALSDADLAAEISMYEAEMPAANLIDWPGYRMYLLLTAEAAQRRARTLAPPQTHLVAA